jgi:heme/copper-type cytochrome/quinol oxidase subunit 3
MSAGTSSSSVAMPSRGVLGMWLFLGTDAAGFGGLLIAGGVLRARATSWPDPYQRFALPLAAGMTLALLLSSLFMSLAVAAASRRARGATLAWLTVTILAGLAFTGGQATEYHDLLTRTPPVGLTSDLPASLFFVTTGFHGLHVLAGLLYLLAMLVGAGRAPQISAGKLAVAALFWHFVDLAWVAIFTVLYLLPTV